jgi:hypothetical protein
MGCGDLDHSSTRGRVSILRMALGLDPSIEVSAFELVGVEIWDHRGKRASTQQVGRVHAEKR